jgi:hypothetical protein
MIQKIFFTIYKSKLIYYKLKFKKMKNAVKFLMIVAIMFIMSACPSGANRAGKSGEMSNDSIRIETCADSLKIENIQHGVDSVRVE